MMRKYLENLTGVITGSEMKNILSLDLMYIGLKGEGISDKTVWITKSHAPLAPFGSSSNIVVTNQMFCCIRNILDVICSLF